MPLDAAKFVMRIARDELKLCTSDFKLESEFTEKSSLLVEHHLSWRSGPTGPAQIENPPAV